MANAVRRYASKVLSEVLTSIGVKLVLALLGIGGAAAALLWSHSSSVTALLQVRLIVTVAFLLWFALLLVSLTVLVAVLIRRKYREWQPPTALNLPAPTKEWKPPTALDLIHATKAPTSETGGRMKLKLIATNSGEECAKTLATIFERHFRWDIEPNTKTGEYFFPAKTDFRGLRLRYRPSIKNDLRAQIESIVFRLLHESPSIDAFPDRDEFNLIQIEVGDAPKQ
jgi:hypothetical protein